MTEIDYAQARFNMIEQQIRPWDVLDQRVLDTLAAVPREDYVPERYRNLAFADVRIPLGYGEVMMNPNVEGRLLQAITLGERDQVLEVGTGSGFLTACLAHLSAGVRSVDIQPAFTASAGEKLQRHGITNVVLESGDASQDWGDRLFDVIVLTGSLTTLSDTWRQRLRVGGRLFAVIGELPVMEATLVMRHSDDEWLTESLFETELAPLQNATKPVAFEF